jgi:YidC/Oxa1 family membrane protein insertase
VTSDTAEREIVVESRAVRAVFTNRGAQLKSWKLKTYFDDRGQPIDVIPEGIPAEEPQAFALITEDAALDRRLREALYKPSATAVDADGAQRELTFEYEDDAGLKVRKHLEFAPKGLPYVVTLTATVTRNGVTIPIAVSSGPGIGDTARAVTSSSFLSPSYYQPPQGLIQRGRSVERIAFTQLPVQPLHEGTFTCAGTDDQYFLGVVLPDGRNTRITYETLSLSTPAGPRNLVRFRARVAGGMTNVRLFLGPKQYDLLAAADREIVRTINFGIFDWLVVPLLQALNWIDGFVGNYGWSIILLTLLINAAIAPLRHRSVVSMRKMQEIQPQVKAIQERYASLKTTDPARQKMNAELMGLYREKGVNPASGCVPLLLTMPVLFAFYSMLSQAIELRGAPFMGWIRDLSTHDPYYVTPLLMGASMVWQQRLTPTTADPVQQRVMMFMPVLFTFMFLWAPSGLVIYWAERRAKPAAGRAQSAP